MKKLSLTFAGLAIIAGVSFQACTKKDKKKDDAPAPHNKSEDTNTSNPKSIETKDQNKATDKKAETQPPVVEPKVEPKVDEKQELPAVTLYKELLFCQASIALFDLDDGLEGCKKQVYNEDSEKQYIRPTWTFMDVLRGQNALNIDSDRKSKLFDSYAQCFFVDKRGYDACNTALKAAL